MFRGLRDFVPLVRRCHRGIRLGLVCEIERIPAQLVPCELCLSLCRITVSALNTRGSMRQPLTRSNLWICSFRPSREKRSCLSALCASGLRAIELMFYDAQKDRRIQEKTKPKEVDTTLKYLLEGMLPCLTTYSQTQDPQWLEGTLHPGSCDSETLAPYHQCGTLVAGACRTQWRDMVKIHSLIQPA